MNTKKIFLILLSGIFSLQASFFDFIPQGRMPEEKCFNNLTSSEKEYLQKEHPNYLDKLAQSFESSESEMIKNLENTPWYLKPFIRAYHVNWLLNQHKKSISTFSDLELLLLLTHPYSQPPTTLGQLISSSEKLCDDYPQIVAVYKNLQNKRNNKNVVSKNLTHTNNTVIQNTHTVPEKVIQPSLKKTSKSPYQALYTQFYKTYNLFN